MSYIGNEPTSVAFLTDQFSGNGSTVAFTMSVAPATTTSILVAITGVVQDPTTYSVVGTTLTFSAAPPTGTGNISVRYLGIPASGVTTTAYRTVTEFTATAGQTTFSVPSYTVGYIDVYRNGSRLGTADFTATNGTTVVLAAAATAGDLVATESFYVSSVLNAIPATAGAVNSTYITDSAVTTAKIADANVTQAKLGTNVAGTGPAFSSYISSAQTITAGVSTLAQFGTEVFDTNSRFNNTGSTVNGIPAYAFMPDVAGYYQINWSLYVVIIAGNGSNLRSYLYKNGSTFINGSFPYSVTLSDLVSAGSSVVYFNGTTDYVQLYGAALFVSSGTPQFANGQANSTFSGALVRAA